MFSVALNFNVGSAVGLKYKSGKDGGIYAEIYPRGIEVKFRLAGEDEYGWKINMELYSSFKGAVIGERR